MVVIDREYAGAAVATLVNGTMTPSVPGVGQTFTVVSDSGYPVSGKFVVVIDRGEASEEKIMVSSRSGTTYTVGQRGYDGTTGQNHADQASCELAFDAVALNQLVDHVDDIEADPHSTKLLNNARHDLEVRHQFGSGLAFGVPATPVALTPDIAGAAGTGNNPAREDHVHNLPAATAVTSGLANAEGTSGSVARADHTHDQSALSIATAELVDLAVTTAKLDNLGVTSGKLAANSVIAGKIAAGAISETADIIDNIISTAKMLAEDPVNYNPTAASFSTNGDMTVGASGTTYGFYYKFGLLAFGWAGFSMAADGNLPSGSGICLPLPVTVKALGSGFRGFGAARARRNSDSFISSGTGVAVQGSTRVTNIATAGSSAEWDATSPFNWGTPGDGSALLDSVWFVVASA